MTRINTGIMPQYLCDQHLIAEHKEIVRVRHVQQSKSEAPNTFKLGTGHVLFFKDKLGYISYRYRQLHNECLKRGFNVTDFSSSFDKYDLSGDYAPTQIATELIKARIKERLEGMSTIRYCGTKVTDKQAVDILNGNI